MARHSIATQDPEHSTKLAWPECPLRFEGNEQLAAKSALKHEFVQLRFGKVMEEQICHDDIALRAGTLAATERRPPCVIRLSIPAV